MPPNPKFARLAEEWEKLIHRPFVCWEAAIATRRALGEGVLFGYDADENPTALLGRSEGGHDFLIVEERFILDFWACAYYGHKPIYDMLEQPDEVERLYGDKSKWEQIGDDE
jgi:hypothetical protein